MLFKIESKPAGHKDQIYRLYVRAFVIHTMPTNTRLLYTYDFKITYLLLSTDISIFVKFILTLEET